MHDLTKYSRSTYTTTIEHASFDKDKLELAIVGDGGTPITIQLSKEDEVDSSVLVPGAELQVEWTEFLESQVVSGLTVNGTQVYHISDEDLDVELAEHERQMFLELRKHYKEFISEYTERTEKLRPELQRRIQVFREKGGEKFDLAWWVVELEISELAEIMLKELETASTWTKDASKYYPKESIDYARNHEMRPEAHITATQIVAAHEIDPAQMEFVPCTITEYIGSPDYSSLTQVDD